MCIKPHLRRSAAIWLPILAMCTFAGPSSAQVDLNSPYVAVPTPAVVGNISWQEAPSDANGQRLPPIQGLPDDGAPQSLDGEPPDAPVEAEVNDRPVGTVEQPAVDPQYALLSARIDELDRLFQRELAEKEEFRESLLAAIGDLASTSTDRELRFFEEAGFRYETADGNYSLVVRGQVQVDTRTFEQENQQPVNNGFFLPRSRVYFSGRVLRPIEYQLSLQRGFNNLNVLNAYVRFRYNQQLRVTIGRFKTPYTYDFYTYKNWHLLSPERSLFNVNFALNRMVGLMANGELLENRLEYAVGVFNGPRNSFRETNSAKDVVAFLNYRPWQGPGGKSLNIGGSVSYGRQDNALRPVVLRTSTNASTSRLDSDSAVNQANVPFLAFNDGVREIGGRNLWELHTSIYLGPLTILAAWDSGYSGYSRPADNSRVSLPLDGYHVQLGYMLTGETLPGPTEVRPARPFDPRDLPYSIGAWQAVARYSFLNLGEEVFTEGLADPALWTRRTQMVDVGLNWYLNRFAKVTLNWEHAIFATPVAYNFTPDLQINSDLFWARLNLVF